MKYVSIDIETTGLDYENNHILSIGAIIEDTKNPLSFEDSPKFHGAIMRRGDVTGSFFALNLNRDLIETISNFQETKDKEKKDKIIEEAGMEFYYEDEIVEAMFRFFWDNDIGREGFNNDNLLDGRMITVEDGKVYPMLTSKIPKMYFNVAGKNFGTFDLRFLETLPRWKQIFRPRAKILDPAILNVNWNKDDALPGLALCKERVGINKEVTHNALEDAWDVIVTIRPAYTGSNK